MKMRDAHQAQVIEMIREEDAEERRRQGEIIACGRSAAVKWVRKKHDVERREARESIARIQHDNEVRLVAQMAACGFVR